MPAPVLTTTVRSVRDVVPGVREIILEAPSEAFEFTAGQWISLHLPVGERPPLIRAYSLAAAPAADGTLALSLDRVPAGLGSEYLFGLQPGDGVEFSGPLGRFVLPEDGSDLLWLARYTGIVPFRSMLQALTAGKEQPSVTLVYSAPSAADLAYADELQALAATHPWLTMYRLPDAAPADDEGVANVLAHLPELPEDPDRLTPMICGKRAFVKPLRDYFIDHGWDRRAVRNESYD